MNHTAEMEKAMHQCHNMGYAEYERSVDQKIKVEKTRRQSYKESQRLLSEINRQIHR